MTPKEAQKIIQKCIEAEVSRGKSMMEAVKRVEEVAIQLAEDGTHPVMGISIMKSIFLGESITDTTNEIIKEIIYNK